MPASAQFHSITATDSLDDSVAVCFDAFQQIAALSSELWECN